MFDISSVRAFSAKRSGKIKYKFKKKDFLRAACFFCLWKRVRLQENYVLEFCDFEKRELENIEDFQHLKRGEYERKMEVPKKQYFVRKAQQNIIFTEFYERGGSWLDRYSTYSLMHVTFAHDFDAKCIDF